MKEYCIYQRINSGEPFIIHIFKDINSAKLKLYELINIEEERGRFYFVDNDFFDNKYIYNLKGMYFCIKEREVTEYTKYCENNILSSNISNLYFFNNYIKKY